MVTANDAPEPSTTLCWNDARRTEVGELPPYPTLPRNPILSEAKIDFSTEKPVLISATLPNPSDGAPVTNDNVPFKSRSPFPASPNTASDGSSPDGSSTSRRIGRFDTERSTHFQSSRSAG